MKKKIVLKVQMNCQKCRSKALEVAAAAYGVNSVAIEGKDKELVVIIGEDVDAVDLTSSMRRKVGHTDLVSVDEVKEAKKEEKKPEKKQEKKESKKEEKIEYTGPPMWISNNYPHPQYVTYEMVYEKNPDPCSIM